MDEQQKLLWSNRLARFSYAEGLGKDKEGFQETLKVWLSYWRDVLMQAEGSKTPLMNLDRAEEIGTLAKQLKPSTIRNVLNALDRTLWQVRTNVNTRLAAEVLLLDLPYI